jgi:iron-sulfur cluster repair protein YtfE (RIC family)
MTPTLPQVAHEHHERLLHHVNRMPEIGDALLTAPAATVREELVALGTFLSSTLLPHMEASEATIYPEMERMLQNRHSMAPMRREHEQIRRLVADIVRLSAEADTRALSLGRSIALRRVVFQLYALLKVHLAEEETYIRIVERGVTDEVGEALAAAMAHPGVPEA